MSPTSPAGEGEFPGKCSVAMCTYNAGEYLQEQLDSIAAQDHLPSEMVIADDGSTDGSMAVLHDFAESVIGRIDVRIIPPEPSSLGPAQNFQRALASATGEYVFLADQDDVWDHTRVSRSLEVLNSEENALLHVTNPDLIGSDGSALGRTQFEAMGLSESQIVGLNSPGSITVASRRNVMPGMAFALRRELLDRALPVPSRWMHDWYLIMWAAALGRLVVSRESGLVSHRIHGRNTMVASRSVAQKARRSLHRRGTSAANADKMRQMLGRLEGNPDGLQPQAVPTLRAKVEFESWRMELPKSPVARSWRVMKSYRNGDYRRCASSGRMTAFQDVLLPQKANGEAN